MKNSLLTIALLLVTFTGLTARTIASRASGNFTSTSTWTNSRTPAAGDTVTITSGHTVTINANLSYSGSLMKIIVYGIWEFSGGGSKISMPAGSTVEIKSGGELQTTGSGGGNSQTIKINGNTVWSKSDGNKSGPYNFDQSGGFTPLPITLLSFTASQDNNATQLTWTTSNEINNSHFTLEKSINGEAFTTIAKIDAAFNSVGTNIYTYTDASSSNCTYRLSQTDYDGTTVPLSMIQSNTKTTANPFKIWPNPSNTGIINIDVPTANENNTLTVFNLNGQKVYQSNLSSGTHNLDLSGTIANGIYIVSLQNANGQVSNVKLIVE